MTDERIERAIYCASAVLRGQFVTVPVYALIELALGGWPDAHKWLCEHAEAFTAQGESLPLDLQEYIVERAKGSPPIVGRGRKPLANLARDITIAVTIKWLVRDEGFSATRNVATDIDSACSIVAKALKRTGIHLSESAVAKIWEHYQRENRAELN